MTPTSSTLPFAQTTPSLLRRRSTGCQWLLPSLLPALRPPPPPVGEEELPSPPSPPLLHLLLQLLQFLLHLLPARSRSLVPGVGLGVGAGRGAGVGEEAGGGYGVCWSSTQSEMGVDGESGWRVVMTSQTVGRLPALSRPGCRTAVAPTKLMRVTSEAPPDSRGIG